MADPRETWEQVSDRLQELGLKLKLHFEQAAEGEGATAEEEDKIKQALRSVGEAVDHAFTALGNAAKDDAVREDARDVGRSLVDALDATFAKLSERFRSTVKRD